MKGGGGERENRKGRGGREQIKETDRHSVSEEQVTTAAAQRYPVPC